MNSSGRDEQERELLAALFEDRTAGGVYFDVAVLRPAGIFVLVGDTENESAAIEAMRPKDARLEIVEIVYRDPTADLIDPDFLIPQISHAREQAWRTNQAFAVLFPGGWALADPAAGENLQACGVELGLESGCNTEAVVGLALDLLGKGDEADDLESVTIERGLFCVTVHPGDPAPQIIAHLEAGD
jgi:hypothetical protein